MNTFKWYIVWVTYQEGIRWLRSRYTIQNVGLIKNTLIENTYALIFISHSSLNEWHYFVFFYLYFNVINALFFSHWHVTLLGLVTQVLSGICYMLILVIFLLLVQISFMQIYSYVILVLNKWGCAWWVFLGTSSLIGSWSNVIRNDKFMFHFHF